MLMSSISHRLTVIFEEGLFGPNLGEGSVVVENGTNRNFDTVFLFDLCTPDLTYAHLALFSRKTQRSRQMTERSE